MDEIDYTHLTNIEIRLHDERMRLNKANSPLEVEQRRVWVSQIEKELADERAFLGLPEKPMSPDMAMDEILKELGVDI